jgi:hypothetical protein
MASMVIAPSAFPAPAATSGGAPVEAEFLAWYQRVAARLRIDPNPDAPDHFYDYRAFYRDMLAGKVTSPDRPGGHFTSTYKLAGHPRAFLADSKGKIFDTRTGLYVDGGRVSPLEINRAEFAPDLPPDRRPRVEEDPKGLGIISGTMHLPRIGAWTADIEIASDKPLRGRVEIRIGPDAGLVLVGTISRSEIYRGSLHARIVGGGNGLGRLANPKHYTTPTARLVLTDILADVGEQLGASDPNVVDFQLEHWTTMRVPAAQAIRCLLGLIESEDPSGEAIAWRIQPDGTLFVGHELWAESEVKTFRQRIGASPQADVWEIELVDPELLPGTTLAGRRIDGVEYRFNGAGLMATTVWLAA